MRTIVALLSALFVTASFTASSAQTGDVRAGIDASNRKFEAAWAKKDAAAVAALYTSTAVLMPPNSAPVSGGQAVLEYWKTALAGVPGPVTLTTTDVESHGDVAHETGSYRITGPDGKVLEKGKYMVIWKRDGGQWKLHRDIWNSDAPPTM